MDILFDALNPTRMKIVIPSARTCRVLLALAFCGSPLLAEAESYTTFTQDDGIFPLAINAAGDVAGDVRLTSGLEVGFVRTVAGDVTTFAIPGAESTVAYGINANGAVVGDYVMLEGNRYVNHVFRRTPAGAIAVFSPPADSAAQAYGINATGDVAGYYAPVDGTGPRTSFVWRADGSVATLSGPSDDYAAQVINDGGLIGGTTAGEPACSGCGAPTTPFIWPIDGAPSPFTVPLTPGTIGTRYATTQVTALNNGGVAAGSVATTICAGQGRCARGTHKSAFVRAADGTVSVFQYSYPRTKDGDRYFGDTSVSGINASGTVVGSYDQGFPFIREADGSVTTFAVPKMDATAAEAINDSGVIAGWATMIDNKGVGHFYGFIRQP